MASQWQINRELERMKSLDDVLNDPRPWEVMMGDWIEETREYNLNPERPINKMIAEEERMRKERKRAKELEAKKAIELKERREKAKRQKELRHQRIKNFNTLITRSFCVLLMFLLSYVPSINAEEKVPLISFGETNKSSLQFAHVIYAEDEIEEKDDAIEIPLAPECSNCKYKTISSTTNNKTPRQKISSEDIIGRNIFEFVKLFNDYNYEFRDISSM